MSFKFGILDALCLFCANQECPLMDAHVSFHLTAVVRIKDVDPVYEHPFHVNCIRLHAPLVVNVFASVAVHFQLVRYVPDYERRHQVWEASMSAIGKCAIAAMYSFTVDSLLWLSVHASLAWSRRKTMMNLGTDVRNGGAVKCHAHVHLFPLCELGEASHLLK